jgi:NAD(P)-dependent dehydrogenase (short-subunit alcohol dehydrogenase family)
VSQQKLRTYEGAVAITTGGAYGIGRALGEELARQRAEVVLADLQVELAEEVAARIRSEGGKARAAALDVRDFDAAQALVGQVATSVSRLPFWRGWIRACSCRNTSAFS